MKAKPALGGARIPLSTYRWQFNSEFTFRQAAETVDYLVELGISDCYASPLFRPRPGSTHGYDVCSFEELNPELGGAPGFEGFARRLQELKLGLLLDLVPNHMSTDLSNSWWCDVLQKGMRSAFAAWFDIDWQPPGGEPRGKVLLPVLEDYYATVLESGKLKFLVENGAAYLAYHQQHFPLAPESWTSLADAGRCACGVFPGASGGAAEAWQFHVREGATSSATGQVGPAAMLTDINGKPGVPRSFDQLHAVVAQQHYRLAYWRAGVDEINYRRFFDVAELVSLRMELGPVFQAAHELVLSLVRAGLVTGVRVDHPDGLYNPQQYLWRLQQALGGMSGASNAAAAASNEEISPFRRPAGARCGGNRSLKEPDRLALYVVVEKILSADERLPGDWPVHGTTGYDFLNRVNGLFINRDNRERMGLIYRTFTGNHVNWEQVVCASKRQVLLVCFKSDLHRLTHRLRRVVTRSRYGQDFSFGQCQEALLQIITAFPVYRTYLNRGSAGMPARERRWVEQAVNEAKMRSLHVDHKILEFVGKLLLLQWPEDFDEAAREDGRQFLMSFQQLTGPVMAKGLEDTAFYRYHRLASLNEVGGDPDAFGVSVEQFHAYNLAQAQDWPHALLATATHDTKRGEDLRARLNVLSEIPEEWSNAVSRWHKLNSPHKRFVVTQPVPDANDEYLLYQTLVGAWVPEAETPEGLASFRDRVRRYMLKAIREAKVHTNWLEPNQAYEAATTHFVDVLLASTGSNAFLEDFKALQRRVAFFGRFNSLSQLLLKLTAPGVPDLYQGTELWDFSLVDPDNRRPVDYTKRCQLLAEMKKRLNGGPELRSEFIRHLWREGETGQIKLFVTWLALHFRSRHRELFEARSYVPLAAFGSRANHVFAFARRHANQEVMVVVPRLVTGLTQGAEEVPVGHRIWGDTLILLPEMTPSRSYRDVLTQHTVSVGEVAARRGLALADVLATFPVALLERI